MRKSVSPSSHTSGGTTRVFSSTHGERSTRRCARRSSATPECRYRFALAVRPDFGARGLERLQPVDVIGVVVADDDARGSRCGVTLRDRGDHRAAEHRRAERVEHHHAVAGDDEARIGHEAAVCGTRHAGVALEEPAVRGYAGGNEDVGVLGMRDAADERAR